MNTDTWDIGDLFAAIVSSSHDAIVSHTLDGKITSWNPSAEKLYGYEAQEILNRSMDLLIPLSCRDEFCMILEKICAGETINHYETVRLNKEGKEIEISISVSPIKNPQGDIVGATSIARELISSQQKRFELAIEAAPTGMLMINRAGEIELANSQVLKMFEYNKEELLGEKIEILVPENSRHNHPEHRLRFFEKPMTRLMGEGRDLFGRKKSGEEFPVEIGLNPLITDEGSFVLASIIDITERKRAQEKFRLALEATPAGILMVNKMGEIELANAQIFKMFRYKKEELVGQKIEILIPERYRSNHPSYRKEYFDDPHIRAMGEGRDLFGLRSDGTEFPVEIGLNPLKTSEGNFVLASIIDITGRKSAEVEIQRSNRELERFAYVVSHDLKAPLRGIATVTEWILEGYKDKLDSDGQENLHLLENRVARMQKLIDGILEYSRIGRVKDEKEDIDLGALLLEILDAIMPPDSFEISIQKQLPYLFAEKVRMAQIFQNLINNAIKFNDKPKGTISIGCEPTSTHWQFFVSDNGPGINEVYQEKVFELFQTLESKDINESTGIGLSLVKKIVEDYGGQIWFKSTVAKGTTFYFTLSKEKTQKGADYVHG